MSLIVTSKYYEPKNYTRYIYFVSEKLNSTSDIEYSILCDASYENTDQVCIEFPPPIIKSKFKTTDIKNWKTEYQDEYFYAHNFAPSFVPKKDLHRFQATPGSVKKFSEDMAYNCTLWKWLVKSVPKWASQIVAFRKVISEQNQDMHINDSCGVKVFLTKSDWKKFKSGNFKEIKLQPGNILELEQKVLPKHLTGSFLTANVNPFVLPKLPIPTKAFKLDSCNLNKPSNEHK